MKTKLSVLLLNAFLIISSLGGTKAQVTIGHSEAPETHAILQVKDQTAATVGGVTAKNGGMILPRVELENKYQLVPFYQGDTTDTNYKTVTKPAHTGLVVYNLKESDEDELCLGFNQWDGGQWNCFQEKIGNAIAVLGNCDSLTFAGRYQNEVMLDGGNYMTIPIHVTKAGAYTITATVKDATSNTKDNGYFFTTTGVFMSTGYYFIQVNGAGTPVEFTPTGNAGDYATVTFNGKEISGANAGCQKRIPVEDSSKKPKFTIDCRTAKAYGTYLLDAELSPTSQYIKVFVIADADAVGATYEIKTDVVAGMSFYAKGVFTSVGQQEITLYPVDGSVPNSTGTQTFTISTNSTTTTATCSVSLIVAYTKKKMLTISDNWNTWGFGPGTPTGSPTGNYAGSYKVMKELTNFGILESSVVKVESIDVVSRDAAASQTALQGTALQSLIDSENIDIIQFSVRYRPDASSATVLKTFLEKGGVVIAMMDNADGAASSAATLINTVMGTSGVTVASINAAGALYKFRDVTDEITDGPFGNLGSKFWGEDSSASLTATGVPEDQIIAYTTDEDYSQAGVPTGVYQGGLTMFRHKTLNFFWVGDGGFLAADNASSETACPFKIDSNNKPIPKPTYGRGVTARDVSVYNSLVWANVLAWAVKAAQR